MAYGICIVENMAGTKDPTALVSVRYAPSNTNTAIENGNVVVVGSLETGSREVHVGATPTAASTKANVVLIASPEVIYDERKQGNLGQFRNEDGDIARGYYLDAAHQVFSISADALDGGAARIVGAVIELQASTKLKAVASLTANSTKIGTLVDTFTKAGVTYYTVETV